MANFMLMNGQPASTAWQTVVGDVFDGAELEQWQRLPNRRSDMANSIQIKRYPRPADNSRPYYVIFRPSTPQAQVFSFALNFNGFIERCQLGTFGNWRFDPQHCAAAVQTLALRKSAEATAVWTSTVDTLNTLRNYVVASAIQIGACPRDRTFRLQRLDPETSLYFQRRVFTKVPTGAQIPPELEDPDEVYSGVRASWKISSVDDPDRLTFWKRNDAGQLVPVAAEAFEPGDFVEVTASIDVAAHVNRKQLAVHLRPQRVILLRSSDQQLEAAPAAAAPAGPAFVAPLLPFTNPEAAATEEETGMEAIEA